MLGDVFSSPINSVTDKASSLAVLTLNVWNREGPWPDRLPLLRSWIQRLQPDLIGFQEVVDPSHMQELLSDYNFHSEWMGTTSGIAIAARWPIHDRHEIWLPGDGKSNGGPALRGMVNSPYGRDCNHWRKEAPTGVMRGTKRAMAAKEQRGLGAMTLPHGRHGQTGASITFLSHNHASMAPARSNTARSCATKKSMTYGPLITLECLLT
jgi:hypothetical protein